MAPRRNDQSQTPSYNNGASGHGDPSSPGRNADPDTERELAALEFAERHPMATATGPQAQAHQVPSRPDSDPAGRYSAHSPRNVRRSIQSREPLHELDPSTPEEHTSGAGMKARDVSPSTATTGPKASIRNSIRASIRKAKADKENKRKRMLGKGTWKDRARDRAAVYYQKLIVEGLLRQRPLPPTKDGRHVPLNPVDANAKGLLDERSGKPYISNFIRSSRYTLYDFIPKQLIYQFSKLGNFYFLVMGILQLIPGLSTVGRWTTIAPLAVFVAFSMAKEGYDDWRRYQLDKVENRSQTTVLVSGVRAGRGNPSHRAIKRQAKKQAKKNEKAAVDGVMLQDLERANGAKPEALGDWMPIQWQHVEVGDIIRLRRDQGIPADVVLLHATGPNGIAYIETMALDGETNLKSKQACPLIVDRCDTMQGLKTTQATVVSEDPNIDLYSYDGRITVDGETLPLSLNNVVYRGSTLRNTSEAIGLVVNSGEECKIRMNANKNVRAKTPAMQSIINMMVLIQIFIVCMLGAGLTIGYSMWKGTESDSFYIVRRGVYNGSVAYVQIFFGYLIMFNTLIPLSLYISLEIIKLGQLLLLQDAEMYDPVTDTPMVANTTTILENLGQVGHVFSDKTGTLTDNLMRFRKLSVAGVAFLHDMDVLRDEDAIRKKIEATERNKKGKEKEPLSTKPLERDQDASNSDTLHERPVPNRLTSTNSLSHWRSSVNPDEEPEMKTEELIDYIQRNPSTPFSRRAKHFLLCIALCHTCLPEYKDDGEIVFQAASPDELALVEAARDLGYLLVDRPSQSIVLQTEDADGTSRTESYQVLDVIEFSSKRKRMSIIVKMPDGRLSVICKGADNVIMARLRLNHLAEQKARDVSRKASTRRTFEQGKANQGQSLQAQDTQASPRNSFALRHGQSAGPLKGLRLSLGRRSTDLHRLSQSEGIAAWLQKRHTDDMSPGRESAEMSWNQRQSTGRMSSYAEGERLIDEGVAANESAVIETCFQHIDDFASEGLRTLMYAYRYIDEASYAKWKELYREAETSLVDRQDRIEEASELIEQKLELAGATAIEDKLQEGVPETIDKLRRANIKVWMLTGDKRETAINIGHSAHLCKPFSELFVLDVEEGNLHDTLTSTLNNVGRGLVPHSVVVVDGQTLWAIDADESLAVLFYDLAIRVDSVICCRASPSQKANLVQSMRRYVPESMTLAIGDGANDIGMIQASHVGIGISGREGLQAARISDYSIAQFRFLQKLLFVHGRWNYLRTGKYVLATFWKEMLFFLVQAHFQRFNGYSGTSLFESWSLTVFNSAFTSLPVILLGIFEKDLDADTLLSVPELYVFGQDGKGFGLLQYFGWMFMGVSGSFVIYYFMWVEYRSANFNEDASLYAMGVICFTVGVIFINIKLLILELHTKTIITFAGLIVSIGGWFLWNLALSGIYTQKLGIYLVRDGFIDNFGRELSWWASILLGLATLTVIELVVQAIRRVYWPTDQDLMQRIEKDAHARSRLQAHALAAEKGEADTLDIREVSNEIGQRGTKVSWADRLRAKAGRPRRERPLPAARTRGSQERHERKQNYVRGSHEDRRARFTPPAEDRENPFETASERRVGYAV